MPKHVACIVIRCVPGCW